MRIKLDENLPVSLVDALRTQSHDAKQGLSRTAYPPRCAAIRSATI